MICSADGCTRPSRRRGMCPMHYRRWLVASPDMPRCSLDGCSKAARTAGLCENHYGQRRRKDQTRPPCAVDGCGRVEEAKRLCYPHYATARRYKLTTDAFVRLLAEVDGQCEICGVAADLSVDHDHATGEVRGLLCSTCNFLIGHAQDDPDVLMAAAAYLLRSADVLVDGGWRPADFLLADCADVLR